MMRVHAGVGRGKLRAGWAMLAVRAAAGAALLALLHGNAFADYAVCAPAVEGGPINSCNTYSSTEGICPVWWNQSTFAFSFTGLSRTDGAFWGHSLEEACAELSQVPHGTGTPVFLGLANGCQWSHLYGDSLDQTATFVQKFYTVCYPPGANPLGPFVVPDPAPGCAYGSGGYRSCPGNSPRDPDAPNPPGTPANGGPSPNIGAPGPETSPGPDQPAPEQKTPAGSGAAGSNAGDSSCTRAGSDGSSVGDPIFPGTGNNFYQETDIAGPRGLNLVRTYNSSLPGWTHNWMLMVNANTTTALVVRHDGRAHRFTGSGPGVWTPEPGTRETLVKLAPTDASQPLWQYTTATDTQEFYDAQGNFMSMTLRGGYSFSAVRSGGLLTDIVDPFGRALHFAYTSGVLSSVAGPDGNGVAYGYDAQHRVTTVSYPGGTSNTYVYENTSYPFALTGVIDGRGIRVSTWGYDAAGRANSYSSAGGVGAYQLAYGTGSATITDPLGTTRTQSYAAAGVKALFAGESQPCAGCTADAASKAFDVDGLLGQTTDFLGVATQFTNDSQRKLPVSITRAAGTPEQQQTSVQWHASFHLPVLLTEPGRTTAFSYDNLGNTLTKTITDTASGASRTWAWTYTAQGLPLTMVDPAGGQWAYVYDAQGNMTGVTDPINRQAQFTYDNAGRVLSGTAPNGLVTSYAYDARGRLTQATRDGDVTTYSYTPAGQLRSVYLSAGYGFFYGYDNAQRLVSVTDTRGPVLNYSLDAMGNPTFENLSYGNTAIQKVNTFDALGRLSTIRGGEGRMTVFNHDANGAVTAVAHYDESTGYQLDALGRPVLITTADGAATRQQWNALGQVTQVVDPKGVPTVYTVNAFGEVASEGSPDAGGLSYERDAAGRVVAMTDARGNRFTISRDAVGQPLQVQSGNQVQAFGYDTGGYVNRIDDKAGSIVLTRDLRGNVLTKTQSVNDNPASPTQYQVAYNYWNNDVTDITYPSGLQVHYIRQSGQVMRIDVQEAGTIRNPDLGGEEGSSGPKRIPKPSVVFLQWLGYTAWNQPQSWTWNSGDSATRSFDREGQMTGNEFATYGYDAAGRMNQVSQNLWYSLANPDGTVQLATTPFNWQVGYDQRGRVTSFARNGASSAFTYDANSNRLTSAESKTSDTDLDGEFDAMDLQKTENRTLNVDTGSNRLLGFKYSTTTVNAGNTHKSANSTVNYTLDANGSLTSDGLRTFEYDEFNRLSKVRALKDGESAIINYLTNAQGQRVFKGEPVAEQTPPGTATLDDGFITWLKKQFGWLFTQAQASASVGTAYVYGDGQIPPWALLGEYDNGSASGKGRTEYIWLPTPDGNAIPVGIYRGGKFYAIHTDHLGTPRLMTDETGAPVWQWPYSAFGLTKPTGVLAATPNPKAAITNQPVLLKATAGPELNLRFPGQYYDSELGTFYNMQRDAMDPAVGRYRQADPIGLAGGGNRFLYASANAITGRDPYGEWDWKTTVQAIGIAIGLAGNPVLKDPGAPPAPPLASGDPPSGSAVGRGLPDPRFSTEPLKIDNSPVTSRPSVSPEPIPSAGPQGVPTPGISPGWLVGPLLATIPGNAGQSNRCQLGEVCTCPRTR